eukprot:COSAG01_NODE_59678_length_299_cov_0.520000_1_plen_67_part_01
MYSEQARAYSPTEANPMTAHLELHEVANGTPRGIKMNSARGFGTGAAAARGGGAALDSVVRTIGEVQ